MALELLPVGHGKLSCTTVSEEPCENVKDTNFACMGESWELRGYTVESFCELSFHFKLPSSYPDHSLSFKHEYSS